MSFFDSLKNAFSSKKEEPKQTPKESNTSLYAFLQGAPNYQYIWLQETDQKDTSSADKAALAALSIIEGLAKGGGNGKTANLTEEDAKKAIATSQNPFTYFTLFPIYQETVKHILETYNKDDLHYRAAVIHRLHHENNKNNILSNMVLHYATGYTKHKGVPITQEQLDLIKSFFYRIHVDAEEDLAQLITDLDMAKAFLQDKELQVLGEVFTRGNAITVADYEKYFLVDTPDTSVVSQDLFNATRFMDIICTNMEIFRPGTHMGVESYNAITEIIKERNGVKKIFDAIRADFSKPGNFKMVFDYSCSYKDQFFYDTNH